MERLAAAGKVEVAKQALGAAELRLRDGYSSTELLDEARRETEEIYRYSATYPSLREIFLQAVRDAARTREAA